MNFKEAVILAKEKNESGYTYLYEQTYQKAYYVALKYMKNEDNSLDVLHDSYIKAFKNIHQLEDGEKFVSWFHAVVARTALDELKKKKPLLFSQTEDEDESFDISNMFQDRTIENQPELYIDQKETSRLVREIIDTLSDEQRACIIMYYIQEMSIKEMASLLNISENTIKSRLNYGRKKIEEKIKELEKKGTKLYGMAPLPFFLCLLKEDVLACVVTKNALGISGLLEVMEIKKAGKVTETATKAGFHAKAATKAVAVIITTAVAGIGVFWGYTKWNETQNESHIEQKEQKEQNTVQTKENERSDELEEYISKQNLLSGKEYKIYQTYTNENQYAPFVYEADSFFNGIIAYAIEDMDGDKENELITVRSEQDGRNYICLEKYDKSSKQVTIQQQIELEKIDTTQDNCFIDFTIIEKDRKKYILYDYYSTWHFIAYTPIGDGFKQTAILWSVDKNEMNEIARYDFHGSSGDEEQIAKAKNMGDCIGLNLAAEQLETIGYGFGYVENPTHLKFSHYLTEKPFGTIETKHEMSWDWQGERQLKESIINASSPTESKIHIATGRIM